LSDALQYLGKNTNSLFGVVVHDQIIEGIVRGPWRQPTVSLLSAAGEVSSSLLDIESVYLDVNLVDNQLVSNSGENAVVADVAENYDLALIVGKNMTSEVMEGEFRSSVLEIARRADLDRDEDAVPNGVDILDSEVLDLSVTIETNDRRCVI
jgi:hypothetical protein